VKQDGSWAAMDYNANVIQHNWEDFKLYLKSIDNG